jgi:hypothetical protein
MNISATAYAETQTGIELALSGGISADAHGFISMSGERVARVAARRAFVEMKLRFMQAARDIPGTCGESLARQVRGCTQAIELWRLRGELFEALDRCPGERTSLHQQEIRRQLGGVFLS